MRMAASLSLARAAASSMSAAPERSASEYVALFLALFKFAPPGFEVIHPSDDRCTGSAPARTA